MKKIGMVIALTACVGMTYGQKLKKEKGKQISSPNVEVVQSQESKTALTVAGAELKTALDSAAYVQGAQMGEYFFLNQIEFNLEAFYAGAKDVISGGRAKIQEPEKTQVMSAFQEYMQMKQMEKAGRESRFNKEVAKSILEQNRQNKAIKETASGLQYQVIKEGTGIRPLATDQVKVHYEGKLYNENGQKFDSSRDRGEPITFPLNGVIKGWTEGVQLMTEGSIYKFWIPSDLGYGDQGFQNVIPGGALLFFEVELIKVNPQ